MEVFKKQIQEIIDDNTFTGVAAQTTFTLTASVGSINALLVYIDGIVRWRNLFFA